MLLCTPLDRLCVGLITLEGEIGRIKTEHNPHKKNNSQAMQGDPDRS